jgi:ActR/RegA family two-component response regulator
MSLTALLVSVDTQTTPMLTRAVGDLGIAAESCSDFASARACLLTQVFDAVLVDCTHERQAIELISAIREIPANKTALVVAIVDGQNRVRDVFARGANFILYKPLSSERAATSLRAARALMRRERRRDQRVAVHTSASMAYAGVEDVPATLLDLSESGIAIQCDRKLPPSCKVYFQFNLPGHVSTVRLSGQIMWQDSTGRIGIRFADVPQTSRRVLSTWFSDNLGKPGSTGTLKVPLKIASAPANAASGLGLTAASAGDRRIRSRHACRLGADVFRLGTSIPNRCTLSDISNGGCYVETTEPFPSGTAVEIVVRTATMKLRVRGSVQAFHPGFGMGVQFNLQSTDQRQQVQEMILLLAQSEAETGVPVDPWKG